MVEDDPDAREGHRDILNMDGYCVETAGGLVEALARDDLRDFTLIVLDRKLPDDPRETALPLLRQRAPGAAIAIVTGFDDLDGAVSAVRHGAHEYLLKPLDGELARLRLGALVERRRAERAGREADEMLRAVIGASPLAIATLDGEGNVLAWNESAEQLFGWAAHEVLGRRIPVVPNEQQPLGSAPWPETDGERRDGVELQRLHQDGRLLDVSLWTAPIRDDRSQLTRVACFYGDASQRKQAELKRLHSQRLAAVQEMVGGLTHECRNALQRSHACLELLEAELAGQPAALDLLQRIQRAHHDLHRLYEEVSTYASPIRLRCERYDLGRLWREAWDRLAPLRLQKRIDFREARGGVDLDCQIDRTVIGEAFRHILQNAIQATPDEGQIAVSVRECQWNRQPSLQLSIRDNGPGLSPEQRRQIFQPFYTTKTKGLGLGMAAVKQMIEAHGGCIELGDTSSGAEIIVTLPREAR